MHIRPMTTPRTANLRGNLEVLLLMLDVAHSVMALILKEPLDGGDDHDHDDDHGHTH